MIYNVSQLLREPVGSSRAYDIDEQVVLPFPGSPAARVAGPLTLVRTPRGVLATATLAAETTLSCSRCLEPAGIPMVLRVEEEYLPAIDPLTGGRLPDPTEPTPFRIDERHHLDLEEGVRQAAVMEEPMQPLCRPDCRGLCPECGADLNVTPCACPQGPVDERWGALQGIMRTE